MWDNFFVAGGPAMIVTLAFGFLLLGALALHMFRRDPRFERVAFALGLATIASGVGGTAVGICKTALYLGEVAKDQQLEVFALGCQESLHNLVLTSIIVIAAVICHIASTLRRTP